MPRRSFTLAAFLSLAIGGSVACAAPAPADDIPLTVPAFGPRFKEIRERIDTLYRNRNGNYPPPNPQLNLFRSAADRSPPPEIVHQKPPEEAPPDAETVIRQVLPTLHGGIVAMPSDGRAYFIANKNRYREGDVILARFHDKPISIAVRQITAASVTLAVDNVEVKVSVNQLRE